MEAHSAWYNRIAQNIGLYQDTLSKKEARRYKLDLLLRVARRVDEFSASCGECQLFQPEIKQLSDELGNLVQVPGKEGRRRHTKAIDRMVKHLQKKHKLVTSRYYIGICIGIGTGLGTALGTALENSTSRYYIGICIGIGTGLGTALGTALENSGAGSAIGIILGLAVGLYLDRKARQENRVI